MFQIKSIFSAITLLIMPKVFISYSWTSQAHQDRIKDWADRLLAEGVDVIFDVYDFTEGQDKYYFMEKMVTDPQVTHVLIFSDKSYTEKADNRTKGVGTESQIISKEVYERVDQEKFIPIVCEFHHNDGPYLPIFLKSRKWIDFSTPEAANQNWERLVRFLHGKPLDVKPAIGKIPAYVTAENTLPTSPLRAKFLNLQQAVLQRKPGIRRYRNEFLQTTFDYVDTLRVRKPPETGTLGAHILEVCSKLVPVRDLIVDWVLLETEDEPSEDFNNSLIEFLEQLHELKARPKEITNGWNEEWFEAHRLFAFEAFLYIVAALLKAHGYKELKNVFSSHFISPVTENYSEQHFKRFDDFYANSQILKGVLSAPGKQFLSPTAELIKRQATRDHLPFGDLIQADLLILLMALITPGTRWYPQLLLYADYNTPFPFFLKARQHKNFQKLAIITGIDTVDALHEAVKQGHQRLDVSRWHNFQRNWIGAMNLNELDTIK
jgi:hypothetical protein